MFVEFVRLSQGETEKQAVSASRCGQNHIRMHLACGARYGPRCVPATQPPFDSALMSIAVSFSLYANENLQPRHISHNARVSGIPNQNPLEYRVQMQLAWRKFRTNPAKKNINLVSGCALTALILLLGGLSKPRVPAQ